MDQRVDISNLSKNMILHRGRQYIYHWVVICYTQVNNTKLTQQQQQQQQHITLLGYTGCSRPYWHACFLDFSPLEGDMVIKSTFYSFIYYAVYVYDVWY